MDILELILKRRTIQSFTNDPVPHDVCLVAVEAALYAPNHKLSLPWRFFKMGAKTRARLAEVYVKLKAEKMTDVTDAVRASLRSKFLEPGEMLVAVIPRVNDEVRAREDYAAMACGLQNMALYLLDKGFGSKWSTGKIIMQPETYEILGLDRTQMDICGLIWIGRAKTIPPAPARPSVEEVLVELP